MKTTHIDRDQFQKLVERDESHFLDFKSAKVSGANLQKACCALANSDGGEILVGVHDQKSKSDTLKRWDGFKAQEDANSLLQSIFQLNPSLNPTCEWIECDFSEGYLLRLTIEKLSDVAETANGSVYVRLGAQSQKLTTQNQIQELKYSKGSRSYEDTPLTDLPTEEITESEEISGFLENYSPTTDSLEFSLKQNLIDKNTFIPKMASALLFHEIPSTVVPTRCAVKISRYETKEDQPERDHLAEQRTLELPLNPLINETVRIVTEMMSSFKVSTSHGLKTLEYPPEAVWETIVNAIIHRDYSIADDVQILIYDNRIEIKSPGKLPGYVTIENILDTRFSRNPKIVRTLNRYQDAPNKDLGEGLNTTFQKMKDFGLKQPEIHEEGNYLVVSLPHTPLAKPEELVLDFLSLNPTISNSQAREISGIRSENAMKQVFYRLRDNGAIEQVPELRGSKSAWRLVE